MTQHHIVDDLSQRNPTRVLAVVAPACIEDVQQAVRRTSGPISVGGARLSMGGQVASPDSVHLDMRGMNRVLELSLQHRTIRVQPGTRWRDIQRCVDPHGLSVKVMQAHADFTVGGSLATNAHGREVGTGPLARAVRSLKLVTHDGSVLEVDRTHRPELFFGTIGGFGALGVIVEAELELAENTRLRRADAAMPLAQYRAHFLGAVRDNADAVFHEALLQGARLDTVRCTTWLRTDEAATFDEPLRSVAHAYPLRQHARWARLASPLRAVGADRLGALLDRRARICWRNYEAGGDVMELEPPSHERFGYVLQTYFVPLETLEAFVGQLAAVLRRHRVGAVDVSVRHVAADADTLLGATPAERFAVTLDHRFRRSEAVDGRIAVWTRELIDAALEAGGTYHLPYQAHATVEQFHRAYPRAEALFTLKRQLDPQFRFTNALWDAYYAPWLRGASADAPQARAGGPVHAVFDDVGLRDDFYRLMQDAFGPLPQDRLHHLIGQACRLHASEEAVYRHVQHRLATVKPLRARLAHVRPAPLRQAAAIAEQARRLLAERTSIDGYAEIGTDGQVLRRLAGGFKTTGAVWLVDEQPAAHPVRELIEAGRLGRRRTRLALDDYAELPESIASDSLDVVACFGGLHQVPPRRLAPFLKSVRRVLRPGGVLLVRDHDVADARAARLAPAMQAVSDAVAGQSWERHAERTRQLLSADGWAARLATVGLKDSGQRLQQDSDATGTTLMAFVKMPMDAERRMRSAPSRWSMPLVPGRHSAFLRAWSPERALPLARLGGCPDPL